MKAWMNDLDEVGSLLAIQYSTDNQNFQVLDQWQGVHTGGTWSPAREMGGSFEAVVPEGGFLYVKISSTRPKGSGTAFLIDDLAFGAELGPLSFASGLIGIRSLGFP